MQKWLLRVPGGRQGWDIDCVVPVPDGSRPAAIQISAELGLPYREGLVKNRYVGRTFIMPDQRSAPCWDLAMAQGQQPVEALQTCC